MNKYSCQKCGLAIIILEGEEPIRACKCDAPIVASLEGHATGSGEIETK